MNREDIIRMAHEAGLHIATDHDWMPIIALAYAQKFAELVAAAEREWQGLTDDEIKEIVGPWGSLPIDGYTRKLFDQIEAKLKEKNA